MARFDLRGGQIQSSTSNPIIRLPYYCLPTAERWRNFSFSREILVFDILGFKTLNGKQGNEPDQRGISDEFSQWTLVRKCSRRH